MTRAKTWLVIYLLLISTLVGFVSVGVSAQQTVFNDPSSSSCTDAGGANTGNGTCSVATTYFRVVTETLTLTATTAGPTATFNVVGSTSGALGTIVSGSAQSVKDSSNFVLVDLTLTDGGTPYIIGDDFEISTTQGSILSEATFDSFNLTQVCLNGCDAGATTLVAGDVQLDGDTSGDVTLKSADTVSTPYTIKMPDAEGVVGRVLKVSALAANVVDLEFGTDEGDSNNLYSAKSASYIITDVDNIRTVGMTTSTTDRTVTLPTLADNLDRIITVKIEDDATGNCTVDGEGAETVDGFSDYVLFGQYASVTVQAGPTEWKILSSRGLKFVKKFHTTDLTSADNGVLTDYDLTSLEIGKTYEVYVQMTTSAAGNDTQLSFEAWNESTNSGTRVAFTRGFTEVSGNGLTMTCKGKFVADNVNLTVSMDSLTAGNTVLSTGVGEISFMELKEVEAAQDVGSFWD